MIPTIKCPKCGYEYPPRNDNHIKECPKCQRPFLYELHQMEENK